MTASTPQQDQARFAVGTESPAETGPAGSRQIRRRLTFGVAGDLADLPPGLSPWQRAQEAWRAADVPWRYGPPPRDRATTPSSAQPARNDTARASRTGSIKDAATRVPAQQPRKSRKPRPAAETPKPETPAKPPAAEKTDKFAKPVESTAVEKTAKPPAARKTAKPPVARKAAGPSAIEEAAEQKAATPAATDRAAERPVAGKGAETPAPGEAAEPAAPQKKELQGAGASNWMRAGVAVAGVAVLAAVGGVFVAGRGEDGSKKPSAPGVVLADEAFATDPAAKGDGLVQDLATVAAEGGTIVAAGTEGDRTPGRERAQFLVSADGGRTWRAARVAAADGPEPPLGDRPRLVSGGSGRWVALGPAADGGTAVWTSADAKAWIRRPGGAAFGPDDRVNALIRTKGGFVAVGGTGTGQAVVWSSADGRAWQRISGLGASGITGLDRVAAMGDVLVAHGTFARKVVTKKGKKQTTNIVRGEGLWRSADGGRTWAGVGVGQAQGSYGPTEGLVAGPGGFFVMREGRRTTGPRKHQRTSRYGVLFTSTDGLSWRPVSQPGIQGFTGVERFGGTPSGLAVLVRTTNGAGTLLRSADGRTWQSGGSVSGPTVSGLTVAAGGAIAVSGHQGDDAYLFGVDLKTVPGAIHPERTIGSVTAGQNGVVAVGSTNGATAIWSAPDGRQWKRGRFQTFPGWLSDVACGSAGWLAVGRTTGPAGGPLAMTSTDGTTWQKATFPTGPAPVGIATGPGGYMAVGTGAAWRSSDLKTWRRTNVGGALTDVAATTKGYVAVGGSAGNPAVWTSPDGTRWTSVKLPSGLPRGPLTKVVARGDTLVATTATSSLLSTDGGKTWTRHDLPGTTITATTATPKGFVAAGTTTDHHATVWASPDGTTWHQVPAPGLTHPGDQRLTALAPIGSDLLAIGMNATQRGETPLLWRTPAP